MRTNRTPSAHDVHRLVFAEAGCFAGALLKNMAKTGIYNRAGTWESKRHAVMGHRSVSAARQVHAPQPIIKVTAARSADRPHDLAGEQGAQPAFATRAYARLLDAIGWRISPSRRRELESHAALKCCFVLRDGRREEAAFGYTATTVPQDRGRATLRAAQARVEHLLTFLEEDRGVLLRNMPLLAFGGPRRDRIALFGGWRFRGGAWQPFLLGPGGLAEVAAQETLFAGNTAPHDMAKIYGHDATKILPRIADLARAVEALCDLEVSGTKPIASLGGLQIVPEGSGWFSARSGRPAHITPIHPDVSKAPVFRHRHSAPSTGGSTPLPGNSPMFTHSVPSTGASTPAPGTGPMFRHKRSDRELPESAGSGYWATDADEFRFHEFGMDRG